MSEYKIDREKAIQLGKELGLKVTFDSETPGVLDPLTGEVRDLMSYFPPDFFEALDKEMEVHHEVLERLGDD